MKKVYLHLQILQKLKKELEDEAKQRGLTLNAYVTMLLIERGK